jgi:hypothetical protein
MSKFLFIITLTIVLFAFLFLNLGRIIDATSNPRKVDLLVCLGGGFYKNRVEKTKELFESDYLKKDKIIFTGYDKIKNFDNVNIINPKGLKNTYEEVVYVKNYMKENGLKSATFISEAPHSRRILLFSKFFGDGEYQFNVVKSEYEWDAQYYYKYPHMRAYVFSEITKIFYNFFLYGLLKNLGLKEQFENNFHQEIIEGKREILGTFK